MIRYLMSAGAVMIGIPVMMMLTDFNTKAVLFYSVVAIYWWVQYLRETS